MSKRLFKNSKLGPEVMMKGQGLVGEGGIEVYMSGGE